MRLWDIISKRRQEDVSIESETTGVNLIQGDNYIDFDDKVAVKLQKAILLLPPKQQLAFKLRDITMNSGSTK